MEEKIKLNLFGYLKYKTLRWLLNDVCKKSDCADCEMARADNRDHFCMCAENGIFVQARDVWGIE